MYDAVVLAAGYSSRAKTNKLLLDLNGRSIIESTISPFLRVCERIIVVTGHYHDDLYEILKQFDQVLIVKNEEYNMGMFSSVQKGVSQTMHDFFVIPGDCPMVHVETLKQLIVEKESTPELMVVPSYDGRRGHPLLMSKSLKAPLLETDQESNLKAFRNRYGLKHVEVNDPGILIDIDTYEAYRGLINQ